MRPFFGPLHLSLLAEPFTLHFVYRRLYKPRRNRLASAITLTVIRHQGSVVDSICAQLRQRLDYSRVPSIRLTERLNRALQIVDLAQRFGHLTMPKRPLQTLNLVPNRCTQPCLTLDETFTVLA